MQVVHSVYLCPRPYAGIFFVGGGGGGARFAIFERKRKRGREAPERGEGGVPPPRRRSFCIFWIEIERSGAHFGWILGGKLSVKQSKKKIHIHGKCMFLRL